MRPAPSFVPLCAAMALVVLSACGVETAGTAATAGAIKQQELEQAQRTQQQVQNQLTQALGKTQERAEAVDKDAR